MIETNPFELIYCCPANVSQSLSPFSASHPQVLISGFRLRCHTAVKRAFPLYRVHQGLQQLIRIYHLAGFDFEELNSISSKILSSVT